MPENSYWIVESPKASERLAEADSRLTREFLAECEFTADRVSTSRMLKNVFWILVTAGVLFAGVWGIFAL
jgi:hypothetical protein